MTPRQATEELDTIGRRVRQRHFPESSVEATFRVIPLRHDLASGVRQAVWILFAASGVVLLNGCVNIANLQLARGAGRRAELAMRAALGATRGRILGQVATENVALGILGGGTGLALAWGAIQTLRFLPAELPRADDIALDGSALPFTLVAAAVAGIFFGMIPAWRASRSRRLTLLPAAGRGILGGRLRNGLLNSEMAVSLVLLAGAWHLVRSLASSGRSIWGSSLATS